MATRFYFGQYWADIQPVRSLYSGSILYWKYRIYEILSGRLVQEGINANLDSARIAAETNIDRLMAEELQSPAA